jgi:SAM-dependent methyltransferase
VRLVRRLLGRDGEPAAGPLRVRVTRGSESFELDPAELGAFDLHEGDELEVVPPERAAGLPRSWGDVVVPTGRGGSVRVPERMRFHELAGFRIPVHLITLSGSTPDEFAEVGERHVRNYRRTMGLEAGMTVLDVGCGVGRDALQLVDLLGERGRYVGVDVARDSVEWCTRTITQRYPRFTFHHVDAHHELYNPFGTLTALDVRLPVDDAAVDRITAVSLLTHLLEDEIVHYLTEFRRVLRPSGRAYVTFFLYSAEAVAAARQVENPWGVEFGHPLGGGFVVHDPGNPRAAVAFTEEALLRVLGRAGLRAVGPYLKGSWSGLHREPDGGQDGAVLARA